MKIFFVSLKHVWPESYLYYFQNLFYQYIHILTIQWLFLKVYFRICEVEIWKPTTFACQSIMDVHFWNSQMWFFNKTKSCMIIIIFFLNTLTKNLSILNWDFNSKTSVLCFITSKGGNENWNSRYKSFIHSSLLVLILFLSSKSYVAFDNVFLDSIWISMEVHFWNHSVFILICF